MPPSSAISPRNNTYSLHTLLDVNPQITSAVRPIELLNERFLLAQYARNGAGKPFGVVCCAHEQTRSGGARGQEGNEGESEDGANLGELQGDEGWWVSVRVHD